MQEKRMLSFRLPLEGRKEDEQRHQQRHQGHPLRCQARRRVNSSGQRAVDKGCAAYSVYLASRDFVHLGHVLGALRGGRVEDAHDRVGAPAARRRRVGSGLQAVGHVVKKDVGRDGRVVGGRRVAVLRAAGIYQASGRVEHAVGAQAVEGKLDLFVLVVLQVVAANGGRCHVGSQLAKVVVASGDIGFARGIEDADEVGDSLLNAEKLRRRLVQERKGSALAHHGILDERAHKGAARVGDCSCEERRLAIVRDG